VGKNNIFKLTIAYKRLRLDSNDNGVRTVNFATSKNLVNKSMMFKHRNIHKYTWTSPDGKFYKHIEHVLTDRRWHLSTFDVQSFRGADCNTIHYLVVAKVRERFAVSKQEAQEFHVDRFNLRKLSDLEIRSSIGFRHQTGLQLWRTLMIAMT